MDTLSHNYSSKNNGVIEGFDRIVFKGIFRPIAYPMGMQSLLKHNNVLNKDYKDWAVSQSNKIVGDASKYVLKESGRVIEYITSRNNRKETIAHKCQRDNKVENGLIGAWSCVESCNTFRAVNDSAAGYPQIKNHSGQCKHLYFYYDHAVLGFMSVRLQTWAPPYEIQIALNGREWLRL